MGIKRVVRVSFIIWATVFSCALGFTQTPITDVTVEYVTTPLGIDIATPRFGWKMKTDLSKKGQSQSAYQIIVSDESGDTTWDSGKVTSDISLAIAYEGEALSPRTRYTFVVHVWDEQGKQSTATSWFETGLMDDNPKSEQWNGAQWIGGGDNDMVFYSHYLSVYKFEYTVQLDKKSKSDKASFIFGANDARLLDKNKNIQGIAATKNESYVNFELDISAVDGSEKGKAKLIVYRKGYSNEDDEHTPFRSYEIPLDKINVKNKYDAHTFYTHCNFGLFKVYLNGEDDEDLISTDDVISASPFAPKGFNLNPIGTGNDYITFPMLADIGFSVNPSQKASFSNIVVRNLRAPSNIIFAENIDSNSTYNGIFSEAIQQNDAIRINENAIEIDGGTTGYKVITDPSQNAAPMLRTEFNTAAKKIAKARLYVTARGIYEMYLNGKRVGEDYFNPGLTQYNKTHLYQTYDVTNMVNSGTNALGGWLSEGWWSGNITYQGDFWNFFGDRQSLLAQLIISYDDGSEQTITTNDEEWELFTNGPIKYGSFFQGEVYDATKENLVENWSTAAYDTNGWKKAVEVPLTGTIYTGKELNFDGFKLTAQVGENPSVIDTLKAIAVDEVRQGVFVYDMGQNMVGFPNIKLPSGSAGDTITMRYAEMRYPDLEEHGDAVGMVMMENIRAALTHDTYIRKGGLETIQPRFTFHGYRYIEITGIDKALPLEAVSGLVVSSIKEITSNYETSNKLVNKLWDNITWSLRGNFLSIPTDTPARNERMGWSGDISVFSEAATYLANIGPFLDRHLLAMRDVQREDGRFTDVAPLGGGFGGTLWGSAGIIVAWETYQQYGDLGLLGRHYDAMKAYVEFLNSKIDSETGILHEGPLGDWLSPEGYKNDDTLLWATYHLRDIEILSKTAALLGKSADAATYQKQYNERKQFLNRTYFDTETGKTVHLGNQSFSFGPPLPKDKMKHKGDFIDTQASYAIPLNFNVLSNEHIQQATANLVASIARSNEDELWVHRPKYSLMTGFIGTASINHALSENGEHETAYKLLQQTTYPSWLYPVVNGATTIWERLNSYTVEDGFGGNNSMNSFNHYSFGAVAAWMYNYSLGIQRDVNIPGFKHFVLQPTPDPTKEMMFAKGYYDSMYGRIASEWQWVDDGWTYSVTVPANTTATLKINTTELGNITVADKKIKKAKGVSFSSQNGKNVVLELVSGTYSFKVNE
ncbi:alpha-L-rhamnosidase [Maribacter sp. MAR_2009_72]|uniref:alpha-L-rhamnosidase n=1 Tax=Maribacter sp. MAR_2009_72 TaxID=1250050 RepID=UPI00119C3320|nr:alpha-L-rhamnosidase [Maribacter sp. MAR_2009_72]TVZ16572.1 alpha-L-rhamnosidase [Maribacter sp. MAR_2009_72]